MRDPLVAPLAAIATGILISRYGGLEAWDTGLAAAAFVALAALSRWRRARLPATACVLLALVCTGVIAELAHRPGPPPELDAGPRERVLLAGCVVEPPASAGDRERFVLELEPGARVQVTRYLREGEAPPPLPYGRRVELEARVRRTRNFENPGAFDYVRYLARRQIHWTASAAEGAPVEMLAGECGSRFRGAILALRTGALERIAALYRGRPYETGMMQAVLIGEAYQLERVWTEHFRSTGTFHALVISGTHVAVLAAFLWFLLRLCCVPQDAARLLIVLACWLYALVSGWQVPVVRSAAGFTLFMIGRYCYREQRIMNLLAAVAIVFLLSDPEQLFEPSFQLSFLAVGFIAAFALPLLERTTAPLARGLADLPDTTRDLHLPPRVAQFRVEMRLLAETLRLWGRAPAGAAPLLIAVPGRAILHVCAVVTVSAVVQLGLALPMVVYFHRIGFSGFSANALVVPLTGAMIPAGFIAVLTGWRPAAELAAWLLAAARVVVDWHARLEPNWRIPAPPAWLGIAVAAALIAAALLDGARPRWRAPALGALFALLVLLVWHPFPPRVLPGALELTAIDVGQGESLLLALPSGRLLMVDGGGLPGYGRALRSRLEIGEDVVSPYLWSRSIRRLDALVLTHVHEDHMNGLAALLENFAPRELWTGATAETPGWRALREAAQRRGVRILPLRRGRPFESGGARFEVLAPAADYAPGAAARNNDSLVLRVRFGRHAFLLTGDIERQVERELLNGSALQSDLLKVAHHGSRTSTTQGFLDAVRPPFALISAGFENAYRYPHPDVLARLAGRGARVLRTDLDGAISVWSDGTRLRVETARDNRRVRGGLYRPF